ncbi:hypothetical protein [Streptomyces sp. NPDC029674]|uniref:hypothetical protein n=1 Tax=Streptomyces sp. NPDC029674 TaxID=3365297 RepID=UPI00384F250B
MAADGLRNVPGGDDPQADGEAAIARLLRANTPGSLSLAAAYAAGFMALWEVQQEGTAPHWHGDIDPLDALFLGAVFPKTFHDEFEFANARDAWLRLLRGTVHGKGIQRFVGEAVSASEELQLPVDDKRLMLALNGRLEGAGLDRRSLPRRLLPEAALQSCRAVHGPSPGLQLPEPPVHAKERIRRFWKATDKDLQFEDTPQAVLRDGLRRFHEAGLPVNDESGLLLPALYTALMVKPGELLEDSEKHASAWALSLDERSPLVPVLDILLLAPRLGMSVAETLGRLVAVPSFTEPIPSEALIWTSSPGLALPRLAFESGIPKVSTLAGEVTPDLLDWVGMHARMRLSSIARGSTADFKGPDISDVAEDVREESDEDWAERREAVREAVLKKVRKRSGRTEPSRRRPGHPVERIWNADGSSVVRFSAGTSHGDETKEVLEGQRDAFREKFGREPGPGDPLFFDPDADTPTGLSKEYFDTMMLDMAERAAERGIDPAFLHAWREVGYVVTEENRSMFTTAEVLAFSRAVVRHQQAQE